MASALQSAIPLSRIRPGNRKILSAHLILFGTWRRWSPTGNFFTDTDISIDGYPGRLVRIEKDKKIWTLRAYLVKQRMYQLMTTEPKAKEANLSAAKFFESFKLLRSPEYAQRALAAAPVESHYY
jgi:hypothetical protein